MKEEISASKKLCFWNTNTQAVKILVRLKKLLVDNSTKYFYAKVNIAFKESRKKVLVKFIKKL